MNFGSIVSSKIARFDNTALQRKADSLVVVAPRNNCVVYRVLLFLKVPRLEWIWKRLMKKNASKGFLQCDITSSTATPTSQRLLINDEKPKAAPPAASTTSEACELLLEREGRQARIVRPDEQTVNGAMHVIHRVMMMRRDLTKSGAPIGPFSNGFLSIIPAFFRLPYFSEDQRMVERIKEHIIRQQKLLSNTYCV